ncbi:hypothetical protein [Sphingomonas faeni]|uniref:hypothetical protein n=1 Tax=Sphingomonas faeni TaxID=185950 RepID=UPI003363AE4D
MLTDFVQRWGKISLEIAEARCEPFCVDRYLENLAPDHSNFSRVHLASRLIPQHGFGANADFSSIGQGNRKEIARGNLGYVTGAFGFLFFLRR